MKTISRKVITMVIMILLPVFTSLGQVSINTDGSAADNSSVLDLKSTNKGLLIPRMTQSQILGITNPVNGLMVFCTTDNKFYVYLASTGIWRELVYGTGSISSFTCGDSITVNHIAGPVAPVNKTVTYNTTNNISGEPTKCWITSNLGSDHPASSFNDDTEASAGWYWQFNKKQGYQYDNNYNRTPNTPWIIGFYENVWRASLDPCSLELGSEWRIPTVTEWYNVYTSDGWTSTQAAYNSLLKIHAGGSLTYTNGMLGGRGTEARIWSSTQESADNAYFLYYNPTYGNHIVAMFKATGAPVRCLKE